MTVKTPWLTRTKLHPRLRLFCLPYAGGGASIYRQWSAYLPSDIEVCPIQLPGRENRLVDVPFTQLSPLVEALASVLQPHLDCPFALFGYSMGALISFELARHLRRHGLPEPQQLLIAAHRAPQLPRLTPTVHTLPDGAFVDALHRLGGTPQAVLQHEELMQMLLPTLRADFSVYETYQYSEEPAFTFPITAFGGEHDAEVSPAQLAAWREQTRCVFNLHMFPGTHFFLHTHQSQLLHKVAQTLSLI